MLPGWGTLPERHYLTDLSLWDEYEAPDFYPLYGRYCNIGLESFSLFSTNDLAEAVDNGTAIALGVRERRRFSLQAGCSKVDQTRRGGRSWQNSPGKWRSSPVGLWV